VPPGVIVDALDRAFHDGLADAPLRGEHAIPGGSMLLMPAADGAGSGVKVLTLEPDNPSAGLPFVQGVYVLFDDRGSPLAAVDAAALTAVRTAAVSAVAARHLAPERGGTLIVFGTGVQARSHLQTVAAELRSSRVVICGRRPEAVADLVAWGAVRGFAAEPGTPADVASAGVVCTCTASSQPLFDGALLRPGALVIAIGAYRPDRRELDSRTVVGSTIVVEDVAAAMAEAGELAIPLAEGTLARDRVALTLADVARGAPVRDLPGRTVVFKSVGVAGEDLAAARALVAAVSG